MVQASAKIWVDGNLVPWEEATVHVTAHALHYGSSVFEGIRAYKTDQGPAIFALGPHVDRFFNSAKVFRMDLPYTREEITQAIVDTVLVNEHQACYIRPLALRGVGTLALNPLSCPIQVIILTQ